MSSKQYPTIGSVQRLSPQADNLIAPNAKIEVLADGFTWSEGPLWVAAGNYLLFSDVPEDKIYKWSEEKGLAVYLQPSGYTGEGKKGREYGSNGLLLDKDGRLVLCQHGDRRMARMNSTLDNPQPTFTTIVDQYQGKRFNSPNDAIFDKKGNLYFTDPPYGLNQLMEDPAKELNFQGVFRFSKNSELSLVSKQLSRPNGVALSPDGRILYVSNSDPQQKIWMAYKLDENGKVLSEKLFFDATDYTEKGLPDGLKVDDAGNVYATGPGGVWIFNADGEPLAIIKTGEATANCAFNEDKSVLYMTCDDYLMRVKLR